VTAREALDDLPDYGGKSSNAAEQRTLDPDRPASTICASSLPPRHYKYDRNINVQEMQALESFPPGFKVLGNTDSQKAEQVCVVISLFCIIMRVF